jgi:hypothetical protein
MIIEVERLKEGDRVRIQDSPELESVYRGQYGVIKSISERSTSYRVLFDRLSPVDVTVSHRYLEPAFRPGDRIKTRNTAGFGQTTKCGTIVSPVAVAGDNRYLVKLDGLTNYLLKYEDLQIMDAGKNGYDTPLLEKDNSLSSEKAPFSVKTLYVPGVLKIFAAYKPTYTYGMTVVLADGLELTTPHPGKDKWKLDKIEGFTKFEGVTVIAKKSMITVDGGKKDFRHFSVSVSDDMTQSWLQEMAKAVNATKQEGPFTLKFAYIKTLYTYFAIVPESQKEYPCAYETLRTLW